MEKFIFSMQIYVIINATQWRTLSRITSKAPHAPKWCYVYTGVFCLWAVSASAASQRVVFGIRVVWRRLGSGRQRMQVALLSSGEPSGRALEPRFVYLLLLGGKLVSACQPKFLISQTTGRAEGQITECALKNQPVFALKRYQHNTSDSPEKDSFQELHLWTVC